MVTLLTQARGTRHSYAILAKMNEWQEDWDESRDRAEHNRRLREVKVAAKKSATKKSSPRGKRRSYIYFVQAKDGGPVKIGRASCRERV